MSETAFIETAAGARLSFRLDRAEPSRPWLVFSNSVLTDMSIWDAQIAALHGNCNILRYDQQGHGASSLAADALSFPDYAADLLTVMDACGVSTCCFVGLSMGVPTGLAALSVAPGRFTAFVAVDGVAKSAPGREVFWSERRSTAERDGMATIAAGTVPRWLPGDTDSERARHLADMIAATPVKGFAAATHALQRYDHSAALQLLTCPFLGMAGELDGAMPDAMRTQFGGLANAEFANIPDAGHLPGFQCPEAFNHRLLSFLHSNMPAAFKETS
ncbi:alpha/beta fold hydrolase [Roseibium sp. Sym1]|uniref:alpha/beta fold hydrolase n=1 Tax=Roseibium sp. Sym1 TaxID=3016006 RepID=UPI0022B568CE|nr:alpha/beta fold hydrolase [Roseibium sp. Sym1]